MIDLTMSSESILDASGTRAAVGSRTSALGSANGGGAGSPATIGSDVATICCSIFLNSCNGIPGEAKLDPEWLMIRFHFGGEVQGRLDRIAALRSLAPLATR